MNMKSSIHSMCFNRYMVECEFNEELLGIGEYDGFNRYMVECEYAKQKFGSNQIIVLIDTWWNVNILPLCVSSNVSGFNRYMVECECFLYLQFNCCDHAFNRYMVECEYDKFASNWFAYIVLIDTWWNVNVFR